LLLAVVAVLDDEGLINLGSLEGRVQGIDEVLVAARDFPPEAVADWCGIDADRIRSLARELAATPRAVVYGRIGLCNQEFGTLASWLVEVVNILTGHFGIEGGALLPAPGHRHDLSTARRRGPLKTGRWKTRVRGARSAGPGPAVVSGRGDRHARRGQVRALVTIAGNPVLSAPDAGRLDDALPLLDAMISIDNYLNETSRHAHVILPACRRSSSRTATRRCGDSRCAARLAGPRDLRCRRTTRRVGDRAAPRRHLGGMPAAAVDVDALDDEFFYARAARYGVAPDVDTGGLRGPDRIADLTLRMSPWGDGYGERPDGLTLDRLKQYEPRHRLRPVVVTDRRRVAHRVGRHRTGARQHPRRPAAPARSHGRAPPPLVLIGRRHVRSNNSWLHNVPALMRGRDRSTLVVHPNDAAERGLVTVTAPGHDRGGFGRGGRRSERRDSPGRGEPAPRLRPRPTGHPLLGRQHPTWPNTNVLMPGTFIDEPSGNDPR
jgi:anaerobic selenocysteine-containing dehydrogenase